MIMLKMMFAQPKLKLLHDTLLTYFLCEFGMGPDRGGGLGQAFGFVEGLKIELKSCFIKQR